MTAQPIDLAQYGLIALDVQPSGHHLPIAPHEAPRPVLLLRLTIDSVLGPKPRPIVLVLRDAAHLDQVRAALDTAVTEAADATRFAGAVAAAVAGEQA